MPSTGNIGHKHPFVKTIASALRARCDIEPGSRLLLAVSGGADSVAMLRAMAVLAGRRQWQLRLTVGHVQHHLRDDAEADAAFTASLAEEHNLPCLRRDLDLSSTEGNLEDAARRARYAALADMAREADASAIVTAHHGDDQTETILMRLLRGASVAGLRGIAWRREVDARSGITVIRPMLQLDRTAVVQYLLELDQNWREDHTNSDLSKVRARLRRDVLPHLHELNPQLAERMVTLTDHFSDVSRLIESSTDAAVRFVDNSVAGEQIVSREQARDMPDVVLIELLRRLCMRANVGPDTLGHRTLGQVVSLIRDREGGHRVVELQNGVTIEITRDDVRVRGKG